MENKTLGELAKENPDKTYRELVEIQKNAKPVKEDEKGACVIGAMKQDRIVLEDKSSRISQLLNEIEGLKKEVKELKLDNKKLAYQVGDLKMNHVRKAGL